jgi:DNA-binding CsgD family transcriptional regulator
VTPGPSLAAAAGLAQALCRATDLDAIEPLLREQLPRLVPADELLVDVSSFALNRPALIRHGVDAAWAARYNSEFYALNPASSGVRRMLDAGGPDARRFEDLSPEPLVETRFFKEYMQPQRHRHSLIGTMPLRPLGSAAAGLIVLLVRYEGRAPFADDELDALRVCLPALSWSLAAAMRASDRWTAEVLRHAFDLPPRLAEVAALIAGGAANKEIAGQLGLTLGTTKHYVHQILEATGASTRADLMRLVRG